MPSPAQVLSDEKQRQTYDQYGEEGLKKGGGGGRSPFDVFSSFGGFGFGQVGGSWVTRVDNYAGADCVHLM